MDYQLQSNNTWLANHSARLIFNFNNFQALQNLRLECRKVRNIFTLVTERQIFPTRLTVINALSCHVMTFQISTTVTR